MTFQGEICWILDGYSSSDVQYAWARSSSNPVGREEGVNLAQYDLVNITTAEGVRISNRHGKLISLGLTTL